MSMSTPPPISIWPGRSATPRCAGPVCGAAETLLVDRAIAADFLPDAAALRAAGCALRGDAAARRWSAIWRRPMTAIG